MKKTLLFILFIFLFFPVFIFATATININTASLQELKTLTGIGDVKAQAIIDARPFSSVDDLLKVKGIGEKTLQKIKDQGLACVEGKTEIKSDIEIIEDVSTINEVITETKTEEIKTYPSGVLINEIMPSPEGSDETEEWIELYNSNNFDVDLTDWKIKDVNGTPTTYTFSPNSTIMALGFILLKRPESKITLNNDADGLSLLTPDGKIINSVEFDKAIKNCSYSKLSSEWQWSTTPTPGFINTASIETSEKSLSKTKKSGNNNSEADSIGISSDNNTNQKKSLSALTGSKINPWFLFLTAVILTIISAIVVIFIKLKLSKTNVRT